MVFLFSYSPVISTQYSEVYWTMMDPVPLDQDVVDKFKGKIMAVVGYETDQVSCDWWRDGHVTTVLTSDWSRVRQRGGPPRAEEELRARALRQERQLQIPRRQQVDI